MQDAKHLLLVDDDAEARGASALVVTSAHPGARVVEVATAVDLVDALVLGGFEVVVVEPAVAWASPSALVDCISRHLPSARLIIFTRDSDPAADALASRPPVTGWIHKEGFGSLLALSQALQSALCADPPQEAGPGLMRLGRRGARSRGYDDRHASETSLPDRADTGTNPPSFASPQTGANPLVAQALTAELPGVTPPLPGVGSSEHSRGPDPVPAAVSSATATVEAPPVGRFTRFGDPQPRSHAPSNTARGGAGEHIGRAPGPNTPRNPNVGAPSRRGPGLARSSYRAEPATGAADEPGEASRATNADRDSMDIGVRVPEVPRPATSQHNASGAAKDNASASPGSMPAHGTFARRTTSVSWTTDLEPAIGDDDLSQRDQGSPDATLESLDDDDGWPEAAPPRPPTLVEAALRRARDSRTAAGTPPPVPARAPAEARLGSVVDVSSARLRGPRALTEAADPDLFDPVAPVRLHQARGGVDASPSVPARPAHIPLPPPIPDIPEVALEMLTESVALCDEDDIETLDVERASLDDPESVSPIDPPLFTESSDPELAMRASLENLEASIGRHGALITWDPLPAVLPLNQLQLTEVLQNLLANAIKFRGRKAPRIHLGVVDQPDGFELSVADNGVGMPREAQRRVFRMFERAHGSAFEGDGVGLAVCKQIVEGAGGRIWLDSVPGVGTTVHFRLPRVHRMAQTE